MREIVSIHIGQAGVQMSNAIWEQLCAEHNLNCTGLLKSNQDADESGLDTFFCASSSNQYVPRAVTVDLEPTVIDEIRTGQYRKLFHPSMLISGVEDASSNFARGHFTIGRFIIDNVINQVRKVVQTCDSLHGFIISSSIGGGTGSGFQTLLLERLSMEFSKFIKLSLVVFPSSKMSMSCVESYNAMLTNHFTMDFSDLCVLFDNHSSYRICNDFLGIEKPTFSNLNRILAHILSSLTVSLRYESSLNSDLDQIVTNIVPFPRIHFPILNAAPLISEARASHKSMTTSEITRMIFDSHNTMISIDTLDGDYLCCSLQYRGNVTPRDVNEALFEIKKHQDINFVDWCPTGFKVGINCHPPLSIPSSGISESNLGVCMLANTSSIKQIFISLRKYFNLLFKKRSFIYWFVGEGMEEGEFVEANDSVNYLITDYTSMNSTASENSEEVIVEEEHINEVDFENTNSVNNDFEVEDKIEHILSDMESVKLSLKNNELNFAKLESINENTLWPNQNDIATNLKSEGKIENEYSIKEVEEDIIDDLLLLNDNQENLAK